MSEIRNTQTTMKVSQEKWEKIFGKNKTQKQFEDIEYVCQECGNKNNWKQFEISTWYIAECSICGKTRQVTEFRDFYWGRYQK